MWNTSLRKVKMTSLPALPCSSGAGSIHQWTSFLQCKTYTVHIIGAEVNNAGTLSALQFRDTASITNHPYLISVADPQLLVCTTH